VYCSKKKYLAPKDILVKRDSIYYQIFKRFPGLLFELVDYHPSQAQNYRFESVEVKETANTSSLLPFALCVSL
jgi:predicted transposase YdaD